MSRFRADSVAVRVPATCANLGPGFDSFGLAVGLHDLVRAAVTSRGVEVQVKGAGADAVRRDESNLVVRSMRATFDTLGVAQPAGLRLSCVNQVPHGRGLGSSSAAIVAGVQSAAALTLDAALDPDAALTLAASLEGHPDNVAACLLGGFTVAWTAEGQARAVALDVHPGVSPVVFVPPASLRTEVARDLLPEQVTHRDAWVNAGRAGLLVAALTQHPQELLAATEDRLHQPFRRTAMPASFALIDSLRRVGVPAVLSGAGPAVLALSAPTQTVEPGRWTPSGWRCLRLPVASAAAAAGPPPHELSGRAERGDVR